MNQHGIPYPLTAQRKRKTLRQIYLDRSERQTDRETDKQTSIQNTETYGR